MASISIQMDEGMSMPYHQGLDLGHAVNFTLPFEPHKDADITSWEPVTSKVDSLTCKFCLVNSFTDVCEVLDIPPEYALRVQSGSFANSAVSACLDDIYNKHAVKLIVRLRFIKELHHYLDSVTVNNPVQSNSSLESVEVIGESEQANQQPEMDIDGIHNMNIQGRNSAGANNTTNNNTKSRDFVVEAVCVGDELVVVVNINANDADALASCEKKIKQALGEGSKSGAISEDDIINTFNSLGKSMDSKLAKKHYAENVHHTIHYAEYKNNTPGQAAAQANTLYPASFRGMSQMISQFVTKWSGSDSDVVVLCDNPVGCDNMVVVQGQDSVTDIAATTTGGPKNVFNLRVTLQSRNKGGNQRSIDEGSDLYEKLFRSMYIAYKTQLSMQDFLKEHSLFNNVKYIKEGKEMMEIVDCQTKALRDVINDNVSMAKRVGADVVENAWLMVKDIPAFVTNFIEKVTTKLPEGGNVNLLIIGKTGHGKSSTANSILRRTAFVTSSGAVSATKSCQCAWTETDGRVFQVVDVPGVCDTDLDSVDSAKLAMRCISEAITSCSSGFHALLLVVRYGNRMTDEEERAIHILKCILGAAIVSTHCICVVTHGDNFDDGMSFSEWCKNQEGFLKEVFEECNYRCVLFNNKTTDPAVTKTQLIELVSLVDNLENRGTCYTNDIFRHAKQDRERLLQELQLPQFREDILRDVSIIQGSFEDCQRATGSNRQIELEKLKIRCEDLRSKLNEVQCAGIADLYQAISGLCQQIHRQEEKDVAEAQLVLERQRFAEEQERLRRAQEIAIQERERIEAQLALETEKRIKELAKKEAELENYRKNYEPKKSRWVKFRDSMFKK